MASANASASNDACPVTKLNPGDWPGGRRNGTNVLSRMSHRVCTQVARLTCFTLFASNGYSKNVRCDGCDPLTSRQATKMAATDSSLYAATKYATLGLSEIVKEEAHKFNISITVLAPASFQSRLHARDYDMWENIRDSDHAATSLILLAEQPAPPPILLVGDNHTITHQTQTDNEVQFIR